MEELIGEMLGLVNDEYGDLAEVVDEMDDSALEVGDELAAAIRGAQAEGGRERAVDVERGDAGVAEVDDLVLGPGERVAQVAERGGLADAGLTSEDGDAGLCGQPAEDAREAEVLLAALVEGRAAAVLGSGRWRRPKRA